MGWKLKTVQTILSILAFYITSAVGKYNSLLQKLLPNTFLLNEYTNLPLSIFIIAYAMSL